MRSLALGAMTIRIPASCSSARSFTSTENRGSFITTSVDLHDEGRAAELLDVAEDLADGVHVLAEAVLLHAAKGNRPGRSRSIARSHGGVARRRRAEGGSWPRSRQARAASAAERRDARKAAQAAVLRGICGPPLSVRVDDEHVFEAFGRFGQLLLGGEVGDDALRHGVVA